MANEVYLSGVDAPIQLGNKGLTIQVKTDGKHRGYIEINRAYIDWYRGKSQTPTGRLHIEDFIKMCEE